MGDGGGGHGAEPLDALPAAGPVGLTPTGWRVGRRRGPAGALHARPLPAPAERRVERLDVDRPALVLGSTQPEADVDPEVLAGRGVDLARRRGGGGAVLLEPGAGLWVDVDVPAGDPLWHDDVAAAFGWLGAAWVRALGAVGVGAEAHAGGLLATEWSRRLCFAGLGPGEVTVDGRKLVGISQRRTRALARFSCYVRRRPDGPVTAALLGLPPAAGAEVDATTATLDLSLDHLFTVMVASLP